MIRVLTCLSILAASPASASGGDSIAEGLVASDWDVPETLTEARSEVCSEFVIGWSRMDDRLSQNVIQYADAYARWSALGCDPAVPVLFDHCLRALFGETPVRIKRFDSEQGEAILFCADEAVEKARALE